MKPLLYVDNDDAQRAESDLKIYVKPALTAYGHLTDKQVVDIKIIHDFWRREPNEVYSMFFSGDYAIVTWSVYTGNSLHNSKLQLLRFLRTAGRSRVREIIYIDASGAIEDTLSSLFLYDDTKELFSILTAIETNYIITYYDSRFVRLRIDFTNDSRVRPAIEKVSAFRHEPVHLHALLK